MAALLSTENISQTFGARTLFHGINLSLNEGERVGMIGPNGAGKSTLLKILAGLETPTEGTRSLRKGARVVYLPQEDTFSPEETVRSSLLNALSNERLEEHEKEVRAEKQISRLEFPDPEQNASSLSGGWRKRLAICRLLVLEPDLVLMDEPTNHLDLDGIFWLEGILAATNLTFLAVSHDRYLLENSCDRIIELSAAYPQGSLSIDGNYSKFLEKREQFLAGQAQQQQSLANQVRREIEWLRRGPKARTTKAKYRVDEAGRMQQELADLRTRNSQNKRVDVDFAASDRRSNKLINLKNVSKSLGGRRLFGDLSVVLERGQKLGLLGANGSGKTTLVKLLTGELTPDEGTIDRGEGIRVALFDQNREQLDLGVTLRQALAPDGDQVYFQDRRIHVAAWSQRFLFRPEQLDLPLSQLSGGEQARVLLARMMLIPADVLILDEPTNNLDIPSLEVLEDSINEFPGAVVLITHDRYLLERVSTGLLGLDGQGGFGLYTDYEHWKEARDEARQKSAVKVEKPTKPTKATGPIKSKGLSYKEKKELETMETDIHVAEELVAELQKRVEDPAVISNHVKLAEACKVLEEAQSRVNQLYARWEELEAKQSGG
ncbi:ABC-F family ATP-binding cassette domain-containing protein [bacterium]|nr:ABC-F family ATP-binding cassette domain-containing protein [bacterium]